MYLILGLHTLIYAHARTRGNDQIIGLLDQLGGVLQ
jgi:hypothetical protein